MIKQTSRKYASSSWDNEGKEKKQLFLTPLNVFLQVAAKVVTKVSIKNILKLLSTEFEISV